MPHNKELKLTKPAQAMELRSLSPVLGRPVAGRRGGVMARAMPYLGATAVGLIAGLFLGYPLGQRQGFIDGLLYGGGGGYGSIALGSCQ